MEDVYTVSTCSLQWRHNQRDGVSNHRRLDSLLNRVFRRRSKFRVIGLCAGNSPVTGEFPAQRASDAKNDSIWWRHHVVFWFGTRGLYQYISLAVAIYDIHPKRILNSNLAKSRLLITYCSVVKSFLKFCTDDPCTNAHIDTSLAIMIRVNYFWSAVKHERASNAYRLTYFILCVPVQEEIMPIKHNLWNIYFQ